MNNAQQDDQLPSSPPVSQGISGEREAPATGTPEAGLSGVGHEVVVPPEVERAGVKVTPTTVTIPPPVAKLGVKPAGTATPPPPAPAAPLPLSDEQIVAGLHQGIASSWRWLAEWCLRRLKQVHLVLRSVHGKVMRVKP